MPQFSVTGVKVGLVMMLKLFKRITNRRWNKEVSIFSGSEWELESAKR